MQVEAITYVRCTPAIEVSEEKARKGKGGIALSFVSGKQEPASRARESLFQKNTYNMTPAEAVDLGNMLLSAAAAHQGGAAHS